MTAEEIINGTGELTPETLAKLKVSELRRVASELFEIKDVSQYNKDQLLYKMKEMLSDFQGDEDRKTVESFIRNLDNQEKAVRNALNIRSAFDRNWFSPEELVNAYCKNIKINISKLKDLDEKDKAKEEYKKNPPTVESIIAELSVISLFGLVKRKSFGQGKKSRTKYKIIMTVVSKSLERAKKEKRDDKASKEVTAG